MNYIVSGLKGGVIGVLGLVLALTVVGLSAPSAVWAQECTPPTLEFVSNTNLEAAVGEEFTYIVVTSAESDSYTLASGLPAGLTFSGGIISGTPTTAGQNTVVFSASNECGTTTAEIGITVYTAVGGSTDSTATTPSAEESVTLNEVPSTGLSPDYALTLLFYLLSLLTLSGLVVSVLTTDQEVAYAGGKTDNRTSTSSGNERRQPYRDRAKTARRNSETSRETNSRTNFSAWKRAHDKQLMSDEPTRVDGIRGSNQG